MFTVAMLDVFYAEPVETVSDHLTDLASALLEKILQFSWQAMAARHGEPQCVIDDEVVYPQMSIVAYGKMGGNELGYGSDLDIIFIHNSGGEKQYTNGEKSIDNQQFFARVAQRVIHFLNTRTYSGILYEADTRLRPDGQSGLMVSSITAFEQYQKEKAWTWEHQALIRARFVTGSALIEQEFDRIRGSVLCSVVKGLGGEDKLLQEVVAMREKMRQHLANKSEAFDVKQDAGGLVDDETMVGIVRDRLAEADVVDLQRAAGVEHQRVAQCLVGEVLVAVGQLQQRARLGAGCELDLGARPQRRWASRLDAAVLFMEAFRQQQGAGAEEDLAAVIQQLHAGRALEHQVEIVDRQRPVHDQRGAAANLHLPVAVFQGASRVELLKLF